MNRDTVHHADRRTFLAGCARTVALGGITAAAGVLISRGQIGGCPYASFRCAACGQLRRCGLPAAVAVRDQQAKRELR